MQCFATHSYANVQEERRISLPSNQLLVDSTIKCLILMAINNVTMMQSGS